MKNKTINKRQIILELSRRKFWIFCHQMDHEFFSTRPFLKDVAIAFQKVEEGSIKSLSVSMPPRAGKSYITSLFCAWRLGRNPTTSVMRNTCTATLYLKFSYDVRAIIKNERFTEIFPEIRLSDDKKNLQGWNLQQSKQVGYFGAGVGGTIIGFGTTLGITDDLYRGIEDAMSDTTNDRIIQWKQATHDSRFESGCSRIDIGTRWSLKDVIGQNTQQGIYDQTIVIPALNDQGESFCDEVMTSEEYQAKKKHTAPEIWSAEYMQQPVDVGGRLFSDMKYIDPEEYNEISQAKGVEGSISYIDVADQGADFTAMAIISVVGGQLYLVDYIYNRENTDITIPLCAGMLEKYKVSYCRVESNSMGAMFSRHLQRITSSKILQVSNTTNKDTRIIMQSAWLQNMVTYLRRDTRDCNLFIESVLSYSKDGKNKNDDAPDCLAGLSIFTQSMFKKLSR
jgi:predicted phage terminase large subunit-like protein